jgi:hypothetical protein
VLFPAACCMTRAMMPPGDQSKVSLMHLFRHRPLAPGTGARQSDRAPHRSIDNRYRLCPHPRAYPA